MRSDFEIGGHKVPAGTRALVDLHVSKLSNHTPVMLPVHVLHGPRPGPAMFLSAAIHGDELNGVEIIRRVLRTLQPGNISGTLLAIPVVNAYGFIGRSRYLPDRRDLNRSFPGSAVGSLASRLAYTFRTEVLARATYGIDLHSAAIHRTNLPQIRVSPGQPEALRLAQAFAAPVTLTSKMRDGSLRATAKQAGVTVLLFEGGEGLRVEDAAVKVAIAGILRVMVAVGMLPASAAPPARSATLHCQKSDWLRAPGAGLMTLLADVGDRVTAGQVLATISDPFGETEIELLAPRPGILLGRAHLPLVNEGDALFHLADLPQDDGDAGTEQDIPDEDEVI